MSPTEKDRKVQSKSGRFFRTEGPGEPPSGTTFADAIAGALHREYGGTAAAVKSVVRLTGANERAVKNWFAAKNGPSGANLVVLLRRSDEVLETVLHLAGRLELVRARRFAGARDKLKEMLAMIDELEGRA